MLFVRLDSRSLFRMSFCPASRVPGSRHLGCERCSRSGRSLLRSSVLALGVLITVETTRLRSRNLAGMRISCVLPSHCRFPFQYFQQRTSNVPAFSPASVRASHETIQPALVRGRSEPSESIGGHPVSCESYPELVSDASTCPPLFRHRAPLGIRSTETPEFLPIGMEF